MQFSLGHRALRPMLRAIESDSILGSDWTSCRGFTTHCFSCGQSPTQTAQQDLQPSTHWFPDPLPFRLPLSGWFFFLMSNKCKHQEKKNKPRSGSGDKTETESPCQSWDRVKKKLTKSQTEKVDQRDPMLTITGSSVLHHCELKILKSQKRRDFFWEEQSEPSARHLYRSHRNMWPSVPPTLMWTRASATADGDAIHSSLALKCTNT